MATETMARPPAPARPDRGLTARARSLVERRSGVIIVLAALATLGFALTLRDLDVSNPPSKYELPADDPVALEMARFQERFGAREQIAVALAYARPLREGDVEAARRLSERLAQLPSVAMVMGPAGTADARFVGRDGRSLLILLELEPVPPGVGPAEARGPLLDAMERTLERERAGFDDHHVAGLALINRAFEEHLRRDLRSFSLFGILVATLLLLILYRDWRAVVVSGGVAVVSLIWSLGIVSLMGTPLSSGVAMMVPLILMLSIAYSAHYVSHWLRSKADRVDALSGMLGAVLPPSLITGIATAAGFLALNASAIGGLRDVGIHYGLGAVAAALLSALVVPSLLYRFVAPGGDTARAGRMTPPARASAALQQVVVGRAGTVMAVAAGLTFAALLGLPRVRVDSNHLAFFDADTRIRRDYAFLDENFGGMVPVEVLVPVREDELPAALDRIGGFAAQLNAIDGIGAVVSPRELSPEAALLPPIPALWRELAAREGAGRYLHALDNGNFVFRVSASAYIQGSEGLARVLEQVRARAHDAFGGTETVTGLMPTFVRTMDRLVRGQAASFAIAFTVIAVLFLVLARSLRTGFFAIVVNVVPVLGVFGIMGWLAIPIDFGTAMIASVLIGIAVHDTVHVLFRLRGERAAGASTEIALERTFESVAPPVLASSVVFCGGLLVLAFSDFAPVRHFGVLSCAVMVGALLADLLLLPALVAATARRT